MNLNSAVVALEDERAKLLRQLVELGANESGELTGDVEFGDGFADAAAATAERTEVLGIVDNVKSMLDDVNAALAKVKAGTYGFCETCGKEIDDARMDYRPTSLYCVDCKSKRS
ncbi:MAG TPA: TraR/DksA C4-type zinc finger protein [Acidimicrobiia bacterium]|jgi:RNA polymerase-binding protein DksA